MTAVTATSRSAYHSPRSDGTQKQRILNVLGEHGPLCDREISELSGVPSHLVPARGSQREQIEIIKDIIKRLSSQYEGGGVPAEQIYAAADAMEIPIDRVKTLIKRLSQNGEIFMPYPGYYRLSSEA